MRNVITQYNEKVNFWDACPQFLLINDIKNYYREDKSKGKKESSDLCWKILLCYHPDSDLYNITGKERHIFGDKFASIIDKNSELVGYLKDACIPQELKSLDDWNRAMKDRDEFLAEQKYTFGYFDDEGKEYKDNTKSLDEMRARTAKLYENLFKIKDDLAKFNSTVSSSKVERMADRDDI